MDGRAPVVGKGGVRPSLSRASQPLKAPQRVPTREEWLDSVQRGNTTLLARFVAAAPEALTWTFEDGRGALHLAAAAGKPKAVAKLHALGAPAGVRDRLARTPLHAAAGVGNFWALPALVAAGVDIDAQDRAQRTALMLAAWHGTVRTVRELLALGAAPDVGDRSGVTALHMAAWKGRVRVVEELLVGNATVDPVDHAGGSPLHKAAMQGQAATVALLAARGALLDLCAPREAPQAPARPRKADAVPAAPWVCAGNPGRAALTSPLWQGGRKWMPCAAPCSLQQLAGRDSRARRSRRRHERSRSRWAHAPALGCIAGAACVSLASAMRCWRGQCVIGLWAALRSA